MQKKETSVRCPNCGAPIKSIPVYGLTVRCAYCDSLINIGDFFPPMASAPALPKPQGHRPVRPSDKPPIREFAPEDYIGYKKRRHMSEQDIIALIEIVLGVAIFFMIPVWLRGCLM